jgi:hypothetical protein
MVEQVSEPDSGTRVRFGPSGQATTIKIGADRDKRAKMTPVIQRARHTHCLIASGPANDQDGTQGVRTGVQQDQSE